MGFFDLNIPYFESDKHITDKSARKTTRLKLIIKAMELGYTGVAYNHTIKGVMSESDRCAISRFPLSSILKLSPSLSTSVKLRRDLLGVPMSNPFRQYTRLTVTVDSPSQASALNSGNPVLKSYDIVAVRPLNQNSFEQASQASEVDLIAIDFSEKLPFRLKQPMVKAAIERGVYFEITYSSLIMDAQVRRQMISNAKLLVDWTRGKNLIFSSAAPSVTELRGPYDVTNLSSLLGLPTERAKAAISKNCRSLIANALRKKQFYKEAIRVEVISSGEQHYSEGSGFDDWLKWDPISSGEGDLFLDDMAKSFRASSKSSKTVKAIDFTSVVDNLASHGLQIKDLISVTNAASEPLDVGKNFSAAEETQVPVAVCGVSEQPDRLDILLDKYHYSLNNTTAKHQTSSCEDSRISFPATDTQKGFISAEEVRNHTAMINGVAHTETEVHDLQPQSCINIFETHVMLLNDNATVDTLEQDTEIASASKAIDSTEMFTQSEDINSSAFKCEESKRLNSLDAILDAQNIGMDKDVMLLDDNATVNILVKDSEIASACNNAVTVTGISTPSKDVDTFAFHSEESKQSDNLDVVLGAQNVSVGEILIEANIKSKLDLSLASCDVSLHECFPERKQFMETGDDSVILADELPVFELNDAMKNKTNYSVANHEPPEEVAMEEREQIEDHTEMNYPTLGESLSGKGRVKRRTSHQASLFPFKRLLNPVPFKKKARKLKKKFNRVSFTS